MPSSADDDDDDHDDDNDTDEHYDVTLHGETTGGRCKDDDDKDDRGPTAFQHETLNPYNTHNIKCHKPVPCPDNTVSSSARIPSPRGCRA